MWQYKYRNRNVRKDATERKGDREITTRGNSPSSEIEWSLSPSFILFSSTHFLEEEEEQHKKKKQLLHHRSHDAGRRKRAERDWGEKGSKSREVLSHDFFLSPFLLSHSFFLTPEKKHRNLALLFYVLILYFFPSLSLSLLFPALFLSSLLGLFSSPIDIYVCIHLSLSLITFCCPLFFFLQFYSHVRPWNEEWTQEGEGEEGEEGERR